MTDDTPKLTKRQISDALARGDRPGEPYGQQVFAVGRAYFEGVTNFDAKKAEKREDPRGVLKELASEDDKQQTTADRVFGSKKLANLLARAEQYSTFNVVIGENGTATFTIGDKSHTLRMGPKALLLLEREGYTKAPQMEKASAEKQLDFAKVISPEEMAAVRAKVENPGAALNQPQGGEKGRSSGTAIGR